MATRKARKVGVLGGIGPEATGEFYSRLIKRLQERGIVRNNSDYPQIIVNSIPAPELINQTVSEEELEEYAEGLRELAKFGPDFIVMVCNTIHLFHGQLQGKIGVPILDLREELRKRLKGTVTVLGTPVSVKSGLYRFEEINYLEPTEKELEALSRAVFDFNRGAEKTKQVGTVRELCEKYLKKGSEKIVLGCTELAVMMKGEGLPAIDTIDVLVEATVEKIC